MTIEFAAHDHPQLPGDIATHPAEPRCGRPAALLLVAGIEPAPRRALPATASRPIRARPTAGSRFNDALLSFLLA